MNVKLKQALVLLGASAMVVSCVDEVNLNAPSTGKLDEVYFTASIAEQDFYGTNKAQTRSTAAEKQRVKAGFYNLAIDGRNDIRLCVSTLDGMFGKPTPIPEEGKDDGTTRGSMLTELAQKPMSVVEYAKTSDGKTIVGEPYTAYTEDGTTWGGSHIQQNSNAVLRTLHAIYPSSESYTIDPTTSTVAYSTPEMSVNQSDLLYAVAEQGLGSEQKETVHLIFDHLLTAVRFKVGSQQLPMSVIKSISIDGIVTSGTYNYSNNTWDLSEAVTGKVSCSLNFNVTGAENTIINGGESTFMLLPQQLTPNAKVTIEYEDYTEGMESTSGTKTLTASLATGSASAWQAGQCITYTLMDHEEQDEYILDVELPKDFGPAGGDQDIKVSSYHYVDGQRIPMRWMVQSYSSDGGKTWMSGGASNPPAGMSVTPTQSSEAETSIRVNLLPAKSVNGPHRDFLRYKTPLGYSGEAFDLSRHDYLNKPCAQTTANCYVVDAPGKYRIPTAYGNAIVNGQTNKDAYTDNAGYKNSNGKNFMAHNGNAITAPMIKNNGISLSRATLVWEDVQNLIDPKSIKLVDDGNAIEFEIKPENIDQGNAVIAAMDGNTVAWSWHIWVTDEKASLAEPISDQVDADNIVDFMPLTLGWCSTANASGQIGRDAAVRITMTDHLVKRSTFAIHQNSSAAEDSFHNMLGNATYYNWGRKDPFPGATTTQVPCGSDENASALPKPFYQAGADAASLGMHAEMHVEYGANWKELFLQGALVGLDGFLTGRSIAQLKNYLKAQKKYPEDFSNSLKVGEERYIVPDEPELIESGSASLVEDIEANNVSMTLEENVAADIVNGDYGTELKELLDNYPLAAREQGWFILGSEEQLVGNSYFGIVLKNPRGEAKFFLNIYQSSILHVKNYDFMTVELYTLTKLGPAPSLTLGHFSGAFIGIASQMAKDEYGHAAAGGIDFGAVLSNTSMFKGGTEWCREMQNHGVSVNYGIQHPNILLRDPISWINHDGVGNLWNAGQIDYDEKNQPVVKSIYDPCPAGYCVPNVKDLSMLNEETTSTSFLGGTSRKTNNNSSIYFPALGFRNFWPGTEPGADATNNINELIIFNGEQGLYWTSSPAINPNEAGEKGAYAINFRGFSSYDDYGEKGYDYTPRVVNGLKLQPSYALPIRPVREKIKK